MTASEETRPQRRVGTFTLGVVLVAAGCAMLASLLRPELDIGWLLKASPLILVALGVETLLSARGGGRVKYDWLGMILCFLLVGAAMVFYAAAWAYENGEFINVRNCSRCADETSFRMDYEFFNGFDSHTLRLEAGDALVGRIDTRNGWLEVEISDEDGNALLEGAPLNGDQRVEVPKTGDYTILVHGRRASGGFVFRASGESTEEALPEGAAVPEETG